MKIYIYFKVPYRFYYLLIYIHFKNIYCNIFRLDHIIVTKA